MQTGVLWFREQMKSKKFRIFMLVGMLLSIGLAAELRMFSYSLSKIFRLLVLIVGLFFIAWIDQHEKKIPNKILKLLLLFRILLLAVEWIQIPGLGFSLLISSFLGLFAGGGMLLLVYFISKGGVGMGDVKLLGTVGSYVGISSIMPVAFLTVLVSAFYSIALLLLKKISLKEEIPFAPFVLAGTILTIALGM